MKNNNSVFGKFIYPLAFLSTIICMGQSSPSTKENKTADYPKETVFEEDFESPEAYRARWQAPSGWLLKTAKIDGVKTKALDIRGGNEDMQGGNEGLSVLGGLTDFDYEADVKIDVSPEAEPPYNQGGAFLFRAQDADNLHMLRLLADHDSFYVRTKKNGEYSADDKHTLTRRVPAEEFFHIKFEVRGNKFKFFIGETRSPDRMELLGEWEGKKPFKDGQLRFSMHWLRTYVGGQHPHLHARAPTA